MSSPSPSPSPSPSSVDDVSTDDVAGASSASLPVEIFLPSHTRKWSEAMRAAHPRYVAQHELAAATPLFPNAAAATASMIVAPASAEAQAAIDATQSFLTTPPAVVTLEARGRVIQNGDEAIVDFGRGKAWLNFDGAADKTIRAGKTMVKVDALVGQAYGEAFEYDEKKGHTATLKRVQRKRGAETAFTDLAHEVTKNNSKLYDRNVSQKLTAAEITAMKAEGKDAQTIVNLLIENSETFANKTEFSQEKYIKKKKARHGGELTIMPATLAKVLDTFYEKDPRKGRGMRPDTIAMILSYANIQAGTNTLVVESCSGILLGSLMYRQQGLGYVIHGFENNQKRTEGVKRFNFSDDIAASLLHVPLEKLLAREIPVTQPSKADTTATQPAASTDSAPAISATSANGELTATHILSHQVDVIIIATRYDPFALISQLWPYLKPAGRFVIYDEVMEPLSNCHAKMCQGALGGSEASMNLILSETFFRNIQVLPNRTHPFVNMSASGGYILTGIKMHIGK